MLYRKLQKSDPRTENNEFLWNFGVSDCLIIFISNDMQKNVLHIVLGYPANFFFTKR